MTYTGTKDPGVQTGCGLNAIKRTLRYPVKKELTKQAQHSTQSNPVDGTINSLNSGLAWVNAGKFNAEG